MKHPSGVSRTKIGRWTKVEEPCPITEADLIWPRRKEKGTLKPCLPPSIDVKGHAVIKDRVCCGRKRGNIVVLFKQLTQPINYTNVWFILVSNSWNNIIYLSKSSCTIYCIFNNKNTIKIIIINYKI